MKTADRILLTATHLFNDRGEHNVSASDIALELDISPGNLYYHFKGKDSMLLALFSQFQRELVVILGTPVSEPTLFSDESDDSPVLRCWFFLTVVLEKMLEHRYLYENLNDLMHRYPEIDRGMRRLIRLKRAACETIADELLADVAGSDSRQRRASLIDAMTLTLTYWLAYDPMINPRESGALTVHRGVLQLLSFCAPYLGEDQQPFYRECETIYDQMVASGDF